MELNQLPLTWYHGTTVNNLNTLKQIEKIEVNHLYANKQVDNGPGFYLTSSDKKAYKRAIQSSRKPNPERKVNLPVVLEYDFDFKKFQALKQSYLILENADKEWAGFILKNRIDIRKIKNPLLDEYLSNRHQDFSLVYSTLADGMIALDIQDFEESPQTDNDLIQFLDHISSQGKTTDELGNQLSIHNKIITDCLTFKKAHRHIK